MKTSVRPVMLCFVLSMMLLCVPALAHNLWLNPGDYYPPVGSTVDIGIGWGHKYPANRIDQEVKEGRVEAIIAIDPDGQTVYLAQASVSLYQLKVEKAGTYLVTARIKPGFFTTTPEGRKWGNKKEIANPIKCTNFHILAKTVIIAGGDHKNLDHAAGMPLELIPLTDLNGLKKGQKIDVQVLFEGKPLPDATVRAAYAGFESDDIAPHAPSKKGRKGGDRHFPVETVTDARGRAVFPLDKAGYWIILLSHRPAYADKETCDECMYNAAFTFEAR